MKKLFAFAMFVVLVAAFNARADEEDRVKQIHKRHDEWVAAWNKHDPKLIASFWMAEGDLIDPFGHQAKGPAAIEAFFVSEHTGKGVMVGTTYAGTITEIRFPEKDVAVVDVEAVVSGMKDAAGKEQPPLKHHVTWVVKKEHGKWMAFAARPCVPVPPPAPAK